MSIAMGELRPFLRLCQFVGLLPFRIEFEQKTNRFKRFSFSLKYPITWWYTLLFLSIIGTLYLNWVTSPSTKIMSDQNTLSGSSSMSMKTAIGLISIVTYGALNLVGIGARFVYLRYSTIKKMLDYMQQVEIGLKTVQMDFKIYLGRRIILGLLLSLCSVKNNLFSRLYLYFNISFLHFHAGDCPSNGKVGDN